MQQVTEGKFVRVTRTQASTFKSLGEVVLTDAFTNGRKAYWVRVDDLPQHMVDALAGTGTPRRIADTPSTYRTPTKPETYVQYGGEVASFVPGSVRADLYNLIRKMARKKPVQRWELIETLAEQGEHTAHTIGATMSYFIHDTDILTIVE